MEKKRAYDMQTRLKAVAMAKKNGITRTLSFFDVPRRTLREWLNKGIHPHPKRVKDPEMEKQLAQWYRERQAAGRPITKDLVFEKAN